MTMNPIEVAVRVVVDLLVRGEYGAIEKLTRGVRLSASELESSIRNYGRTLVPPGPAWWTSVTITPVVAEGPPAVHLAVPLWTAEEGRSDLTLELKLTQSAWGTLDTEVLDIHVL